MSQQAETPQKSSRWETALLSFFVLGAVWAGYVLLNNQAAKPPVKSIASHPAESNALQDLIEEAVNEHPTEPGAAHAEVPAGHAAAESRHTEGAEAQATPMVGPSPVVESSETVPPQAEMPLIAPPALTVWQARQQALTQRLRKSVSRPLNLAYVFSLFPVRLHEMQSFENFTIVHGLPLAGSVYSAAHGPVCVEFAWTPIPFPDVSYSLEVAKVRGFDFYRSFGSQTTGVKVQFQTGADYFWRVRAVKERNEAVSDIQSFMVTAPPETAEQKRIRAIASRVRDTNASLSDLSYCR